jgi:hypothetical protein
MKVDIASTILALAPLAAAHGAVTSYIIDGTNYAGYDGFNKASTPNTIQRQWPGKFHF